MAARDVVIEGDDEAQLAIRFNIFQLLIAAPRTMNASIWAQKPSAAMATAGTLSGIRKSSCCRSLPITA